MFIIVVGGGKVGYHLTKELLASGHEVVLVEKDRDWAAQIAHEIGSVVLNRDGCEGRYLAEAGAHRAAVVAAVTGDDEDNLTVCQMAKHHFNVPRTIARVSNPKNELLFRKLGVDEVINPTHMALGAIEQNIPVHYLLHLAQLSAGDLEVVEAQIEPDSPAAGKVPRDLVLPDGCILFVVIRGAAVQAIRADTLLQPGDRLVALSRAESQDEVRRLLIGDRPEPGEAS